MLRSRITLLLTPFFLTVGCFSPAAAVNHIDAVEPTTIAWGADANIVISGDFWAQTQVDFGGGGATDVNDTFRASLGGVTLRNVTYVDAQTLHAEVPASTPAGVYDLKITGPNDASATLSQAITVIPAACAGATCRILNANLSVSPAQGTTNEDFTAVGAVSDPNSATGTVYYLWDWTSDGHYDAFGPRAVHRYHAAGTYTVTLAIVDAGGSSATAQMKVGVSKPGH